MTKDKVKPDSADKVYWRQNETFADLFNAYLYNGEQVIKSEELEELDTDKFLPVITLVLYYGEKDWDGPRSLYDMLVIPDRIKHFVGNYPINIIQMKDNDLVLHNQYNVDLFEIISIIYDAKKTVAQRIAALRKYEADRVVDEKVIDVIVTTTNMKINNKKAGERTLCTFWDEAREQERELGREVEIFTSVQDGDYGIKRGAEKLGITEKQFIEKMGEAGFKIPETV